MICFTHPLGNANVRSAVYGLTNTNLLTEFHTCIAFFEGSLIDRLGSCGALSEVRRRRFDKALKPITNTWPLLEIGRLMSSKAGFAKLTEHEIGIFSIDSVFRSFDRHVATSLKKAAKKGVKGVYAFEDGAEFSFQEAKKIGLKTFYDLPIGYWRAARRLLEIERDRRPEWISTLKGFRDSDMKLMRKDRELMLADKIYVASSFTAKTLQDFPGALPPIEVIPYGFPSVLLNRKSPSIPSNKRLKLLFVGGLSQRKGIADLFEAVEALKSYVELTVVGRKVTNDCPALNTELNKHKWIPSLSHEDILKVMGEQDVLVFPSLFEGFGLVITEAMSQGMPVITTERTAGPDLIEHGQNGWLIEAGSAQAIQTILEELIRCPKKVYESGKEALITAGNRPWNVYSQELAEAVRRDLVFNS